MGPNTRSTVVDGLSTDSVVLYMKEILTILIILTIHERKTAFTELATKRTKELIPMIKARLSLQLQNESSLSLKHDLH